MLECKRLLRNSSKHFLEMSTFWLFFFSFDASRKVEQRKVVSIDKLSLNWIENYFC